MSHRARKRKTETKKGKTKTMKDKYIFYGLLLSAALVFLPAVLKAACPKTKAGQSDNECGSGSCSYTEYDQLVICVTGADNEKCKEEGTNVNTKSRVVSGTCSGQHCTQGLSYGNWSDPVSNAAKTTEVCGTGG